MRVLLLEDDEMLGAGLQAFLRHEGHRIDWCQHIAQAELLQNEPFDAFVVDWNLPDGSGLKWVRSLRSRGLTLPILIMTARDRLEDRVKGLDVGADDYLVKPFHPEELEARIRANCRRATPAALVGLRRGNVELDLAGHIATVDGEGVALTSREWRLLEVLIHRHGRYISKSDMDALVMGGESDLNSNAIEVHVSSLRKKLGRDLIETSRGVGYRLAG